jgi:hypothetical protein
MAGDLGSAFGAWWLTTQRRSRIYSSAESRRQRGTVIFDNTPTAADVDAIL